MKSRLIAINLLLLAVLLVACRNQPTPTPTPEPTTEPTPEQVATETSPTAEGVVAEATTPALVASVAGLQGKLWQWERSRNPNTGEETPVANPESYTLVFNADNTYDFQADCNTGAGTYTADDSGSIRFTPGPMTLAACPPESLSETMLNMMAAVQNYALEEDGNVLRLSWPAGGPMDYYRNAGPAEAAQTPPAAPVAVSASDNPELIGPTWYWNRFDDTAETNNIVVEEPGRYTITFNPDGTAAIRADCNQVTAAYTLQDSALTITPGPSTMAACPPDSLDQEFLANLSNVATYVIEEGILYLNLFADAGNMVFAGNNVGIDPRQVHIYAADIPYSWQANLVPGTPYDESSPPGPMGLPDHIQINFGVTNPADRQPTDPIMYIIPVSAYQALWEEAGNTAVSDTIDRIFQDTLALPYPPPSSSMAALPYEEVAGFNDIVAQLGNPITFGESATKNGYRFIGRWAQDPNPVTNQGLRYVYQGFTNDGQYLVAFFYPVTTPALPATAADVPAEEMNALNADPAAYTAQKAAELNALPGEEWEPDLQTLDNLVGSLTIGGMPFNPLTGNVWLLAGQSGPEGEVPVESSANHTVSFHADGRLEWQGECNNGSGVYGVSGGMAGSLAIELGAATLAACPNSVEETMVATLSTTQSYRAHPGGSRLDLLMPLDLGYLIFSKFGPADANPPAEQPELPIEPPPAGAPSGRVIAEAGVNVRSGPGSNYPILGVAPFGAEGEIIGRSADGQYWVTPLESMNTIGWVAAAYVEAANAENVPVIPAPAPPIPTATPLPPATATPAPEINFSADPTTINEGECTTLSWRVENIQAVWVYPLGQPYNQYPVTGEGNRQECPTFTTTYEMRVLKTDGTIELRQVTVVVNVANPLADTGWQLVARNVNIPPLPDSTITLLFAADQLSGSGGCNTYNGAYAVTGNNLSISPLAITRSSCGEELDAQEAAYIQALQGATSYQIIGAQLIIRDASGAEVLRYNRTS